MAEKCGDELGYRSYLYILDKGRNERQKERKKNRNIDEGVQGLQHVPEEAHTHSHARLSP